MKIWRLMGHYDAETNTWSACAGTAQTSPYTPDFNGTLVGTRTVVSAVAATTLTEHVELRLTSAQWTPNVCELAAQGNGLQTAPAIAGQTLDFSVNLPVKAGVPITVEGRCPDGTDVTNSVFLYGCFEV